MMIKFFKKYKYIGLTVGVFAVVIVSGAFLAYVRYMKREESTLEPLTCVFVAAGDGMEPNYACADDLFKNHKGWD